MSTGDNDVNEAVAKDIIATGAAADSVDLDDDLKELPRLLRYAVLSNRHAEFICARLLADIAEIVPGLAATVPWAEDPGPDLGLVLATELDHLAVINDKPDLRSMADCVRLLSLPMPILDKHREDHRRLTKALLQALRRLPARTDAELASEIEAISFGWATLPVADDALSRLTHRSASETATMLGKEMAHWRVTAAMAALRNEYEERRQASEKVEKNLDDVKALDASTDRKPIPTDHVVACQMTESAAKNPKMKELIGPLKHVVNVALPLVPVPPLHGVRRKLLFEFPYAEAAIDFALADLVGRGTVKLRPLIIFGDAGGGKSRFVRRLGEILNVSTWRTDASRSDGATFGGTDKRWYSAEPCHPFLAIAQAKHANPLILIDELEKAGTRSDYGRFWDCLLGFLEPESAARYPDPALQTALDLGHISYVATANTLDPLPSPLRDRFRIVTFPKPGPEHLDALLAPVIVDLAAERGLDQRWIEPFAAFERDVVAAHWRGGSVRQLRRVVDAVLNAREKASSRN